MKGLIIIGVIVAVLILIEAHRNYKRKNAKSEYVLVETYINVKGKKEHVNSRHFRLDDISYLINLFSSFNGEMKLTFKDLKGGDYRAIKRLSDTIEIHIYRGDQYSFWDH